MQYKQYYLLVEGSAHSAHRNPEGIYRIDVIDDETTVDITANIAIDTGKSTIPFIGEGLAQHSIRIFDDSGSEITLTQTASNLPQKGLFIGRVELPKGFIQ